jgi:membrane protease YdiL (CAAX protease family)
MSDEAEDRSFTLRAIVAVEGGLVGLALLLGWLLNQPPLETFHWNGHDFLLALAATVPMLLVAGAMIRWPVGPLRELKRLTEQLLLPLFAPLTLLDLLMVSLLAGVGEEMLFRGVLQGAFQRWAEPWWALAMASALFGLVHAVNTTYALLAMALGAYLGWIWMWTGNLLVVVLMHALYDFVLLVWLLSRPLPPQEPEMDAEDAEIEDENPPEA